MKLSLYYPLKPHYVTQKFGETAFLSYYKENGVTFSGHNGMDLVCHHGDPIRATHDGLAYYQVDQKQGHGVVIITEDKYDYGAGMFNFKTIYWHLVDPVKEPKYKSPIQGHDGMRVKAGDIIGYTDSTGLSTGDHLHFGCKPVMKGEPNKAWGNVLQNNGYQGAIDPEPFFNGKYAEDVKKYVFDKDMAVGDDNEDVRQLQKKLRMLGYFNFPTDTGYYGEATRTAVYRFQLDYVRLSWVARNIYRGLYCYAATREALNKINNLI